MAISRKGVVIELEWTTGFIGWDLRDAMGSIKHYTPRKSMGTDTGVNVYKHALSSIYYL